MEQLASLRQTLGDRLVLHGKLPSTALFAVLDECVALLAPSLEEMFGNQLIEGLMRGCHGIVAEGTALAENVRRFGNGSVCCQGSASSLTESVEKVLDVPYNQASAEDARVKIRSYMSPGVVARSHAELYARLAEPTL